MFFSKRISETSRWTLGTSSLLLATFFFSFFGVLTRMVGFELPLFYQAVVRDITSVLILALPLWVSKGWKSVEKRDWKWIALRSFGGFIGFFATFVSFYYLPLSTAYLIFYSGATLGGYALGSVIFNEKLTPVKIASLCLVLVGLSLIYSLSLDSSQSLYVACALAGGLGTAVWNTFSKKISGEYAATQLNLLDFSFSLLFAGTASLLLREGWVIPTLSKVWVANLLFVVMFLVTGQLVIYGFKYLEAQIGSLIMLMEIIFGIILGYVIFNEHISWATAVGGALVVLGVAAPELVFFIHRRRKK